MKYLRGGGLACKELFWSEGQASSRLLFLPSAFPSGASGRLSSCLIQRNPHSPSKLHLPKKHPSITTASRLSPIQPPGSALDGNYAASLLFPTVQLIHFKLPFFFFNLGETNVSLSAQFLGYATCMNQTFNHLLGGLWRSAEPVAGRTELLWPSPSCWEQPGSGLVTFPAQAGTQQ